MASLFSYRDHTLPITYTGVDDESRTMVDEREHNHRRQANELDKVKGALIDEYDEIKKSMPGKQKTQISSDEPKCVESPSLYDRLGQEEEKETVLKLSPARLCELTSSPQWLPLRKSIERLDHQKFDDVQTPQERRTVSEAPGRETRKGERANDRSQPHDVVATPVAALEGDQFTPVTPWSQALEHNGRPHSSARTVSTPMLKRRRSSSKVTGSSKFHHTSSSKHLKITPVPLRLDVTKAAIEEPEPSPMPQSIPIPPLSLPTYLQLELSSQRPSPLYIHRSVTSDYPYESSRVKIERLKNFLFLPPQLEQILWFGALACLDAWLYSFTILPLRFFRALSVLAQSWCRSIVMEARFVASFIYAGAGRMWYRRLRRENSSRITTASTERQAPIHKDYMDGNATPTPADKAIEYDLFPMPDFRRKARRSSTQKHRRTKSMPSALTQDHKADLLKGMLILISCIVLMYFDASRMYHGIRGQAAIKLYVIYNVLEVCDRLFSALGQDVLECLLSKEALERGADGRSKVWRPFWLFLLALCYNLVHSTALFYQVITLNVAVNSYSNALLTLLMSNQFVEIKSTVFKKFEKDNLFQLTCADVVERFQLWLMLIIIASRNIIETGGLSLGSSSDNQGGGFASAASSSGSGILPKSFTIFPEWTGQIMGPFILVLGSEMLVDWIKHAYVTKFNNTKPAIYGRFLDVLAKDYYTQAFADQNLTRRLGLPVIPLACLFIRASVQTYHMFLATHMPHPLPSTATSISLDSATASPATTAALQHIDDVFRRALGRSTFRAGNPALAATSSFWNVDDIIAFIAMAVFFLLLFLALLALKLVLGMCLLSFARRRYRGMKERENASMHAEGRRVGGWGVVEVDEDKRRWIYQDDLDGLRKLREKEKEVQEKEKRADKQGGESFNGVSRYTMAAKRIW